MIKKIKVSLFFYLFITTVAAQNGTVVTRQPLDIFANEDLAERISYVEKGERHLKEAYLYLEEVSIEEITYLSDGLKVKAYMAKPKVEGVYPSVIYNRGGNKEFGKLNAYKAVFILARMAHWGYVVVASQYRGNDGGEGKEEFGGSDVNDVLNLVATLEQEEQADTSKMALYGWSRGGMMTYLSLTKSCRFKAAIVGGGVSDLWALMRTRQDTFETVFAENIPDYAMNTKAALDARSAIWRVDEICKTTPILMLHGTADWRVVPEMALDLSKAFIHADIPHRLVMFEGGNHALSGHRGEVNQMVKAWLERYLR